MLPVHAFGQCSDRRQGCSGREGPGCRVRAVNRDRAGLRREASRGRGTRVRCQTGTGGAGMTGRQQGFEESAGGGVRSQIGTGGAAVAGWQQEWEKGAGGGVRSQPGPGGAAATGRQLRWEEGACGGVRGYGNRRGGRARQVRLGRWATSKCPLRGSRAIDAGVASRFSSDAKPPSGSQPWKGRTGAQPDRTGRCGGDRPAAGMGGGCGRGGARVREQARWSCTASATRALGEGRVLVAWKWILALRPASIRMQRVATRAYNHVEPMFEVWNMGLNCRSLG